MIPSLQSCVRKGKFVLMRWTADPKLLSVMQGILYIISGFLLSAASLGGYCMPLSMALVCAASGYSVILAAVGGVLGYRLFWGTYGYIGMFWIIGGLLAALLLGEKRFSRQWTMLLPAVAGLITAASGVLFQVAFADMTPIPIYLLRVLLGGAAAMLIARILRERNPILDWLGGGLAVLALAQVVPFPYLGLGYCAAGFTATSGAFPLAVLAGLALDMAGITPVPMTAVMALGYLVRFLPRCPKWLGVAALGSVCIVLMQLTGRWDLHPLPGLLLGAMVGTWISVPGKTAHRRGETGVAQVRLELAAGVLTQTESLLLESEAPPVDEAALLDRATERACSGCAYRKNCRDIQRLGQLPAATLHKPLLSVEELPILCRKPGRLLAELHRGQEQLRSIRADRQRQKEYRAAVVQQYRFLSSFLQELADQLPRRAESAGNAFRPEITVCGNRKEQDNGDRCLRFAGVGKKYYVLLCDGMGTGPGAVREGKTASGLLKRMLCAGYPAEYALRSLNSLCALRDRAGAITVDLAELSLDSGKVRIYKWGAAPSYLTTRYGAERLGTVSPPPGLSVMDEQERVEHTSLRRGEWLVMVTDGIGQREALRCCTELGDSTPGELGASLMACGELAGQDDATAAIIRLVPA